MSGVDVEPAAPWDWCKPCGEQVTDDMRMGEWFDGSEGTCRGCGTLYHAVSFTDGSWELLEYGPDSVDSVSP